MSHREPQPHLESQLLANFLDQRDVPCPRCGYNLRNITRGRCPECGDELRLALSLREKPAIAWWIDVLVFVLLGMSTVGLIYFMVLCVIHDQNEWLKQLTGWLTLQFVLAAGLAVATTIRRVRFKARPYHVAWLYASVMLTFSFLIATLAVLIILLG